MIKAFWRGVWAGVWGLVWAGLLGLSTWDEWVPGIVIGLTMLVCHVMSVILWFQKNKAEDARVARIPNVFGYADRGRVVWQKVAFVVDKESEEAAVFVDGPSLEQVELGLFEDGWTHTSKGWTK